MWPTLTIKNASDTALVNLKAFGYEFVGKFLELIAPYATNIRLSKLCRVLGIPEKLWSPSFSDTIKGVVQSCADKKVLWVNARRIIASVAYEHAFWNWSVMQSVGISASHPYRLVDFHRSVASWFFGTRPNPATIVLFGFVNALPKSFFWRMLLPPTKHHSFCDNGWIVFHADRVMHTILMINSKGGGLRL